MSDMTPLRNNAIVNNATVAQAVPGQVQTGALSTVLMKTVPHGPQIRQGHQQEAVQILAPNSKGTQVTGQLPMVQVRMGAKGPQPDNGQGDQKVIIMDNKPRVSSGGHPMVQVQMANGKPQPVQTMPTVAEAPPRLPGAMPVLSAPRSGVGAPRLALPARTVPAVVAATVAPPIPELTEEQLMLCRHSVEQYLAALRSIEGGTPEEYLQVGEATIASLDEIMAAQAARDAAPSSPIVSVQTITAQAAQSISPAPTVLTTASTIAATPQVSYVAGRVVSGIARQPMTQPITGQPQRGGYSMANARGQRNMGLAPRRTTVRRPGESPLPMVEVNMNGKQPQVKNAAEVQAARAQALSPQALPADLVAQLSALPPEGALAPSGSTETILEPQA